MLRVPRSTSSAGRTGSTFSSAWASSRAISSRSPASTPTRSASCRATDRMPVSSPRGSSSARRSTTGRARSRQAIRAVKGVRRSCETWAIHSRRRTSRWARSRNSSATRFRESSSARASIAISSAPPTAKGHGGSVSSCTGRPTIAASRAIRTVTRRETATERSTATRKVMLHETTRASHSIRRATRCTSSGTSYSAPSASPCSHDAAPSRVGPKVAKASGARKSRTSQPSRRSSPMTGCWWCPRGGAPGPGSRALGSQRWPTDQGRSSLAATTMRSRSSHRKPSSVDASSSPTRSIAASEGCRRPSASATAPSRSRSAIVAGSRWRGSERTPRSPTDSPSERATLTPRAGTPKKPNTRS